MQLVFRSFLLNKPCAAPFGGGFGRPMSDGRGEQKDLDERHNLQCGEVGEDGLEFVGQKKTQKPDDTLPPLPLLFLEKGFRENANNVMTVQNVWEVKHYY